MNTELLNEISDNLQHGRAKTVKEKLLSRLTGACVTSLLGVAVLVPGLVMCCKYSWNFADGPGPLVVMLGGMLIAVGIALFVVFFTGRKMLSKEIEAEEESLKSTDKTA